MKFTDKKTIQIDRDLSDLDTFTLDFVKILKKHTNYVIVSGYVAIILGRARASEDVDIIIPRIDFSTFQVFYNELKENNFYCLNAEKDDIVFSYLEDNLAVRFAKIGSMIPNIEMKWTKNDFETIALDNAIDIKFKNKLLCISPFELQIAFKEAVLKSPKDLDDATHIREVTKEFIDNDLIQKYKEMLRGFYRREQ